jgi:hypothetical protein
MSLSDCKDGGTVDLDYKWQSDGCCVLALITTSNECNQGQGLFGGF